MILENVIVAMRGRNPTNPSDRNKGCPTEQRLEMNKDNCVNALTTVQKDNLVLELKKAVTTRGSDVVSTLRASYYKNGERNIRENIETAKGYEGVVEIKQTTRQERIKAKILPNGNIRFYQDDERKSGVSEAQIQNIDNVSHTITTGNARIFSKGNAETCYRIRKLTPRECWRLMGYTDADFDRAASVNSNTQLYKQAGNAIVKQVLMAIFSQLNIKGVMPWNERTIEERNKLVRGI